MLSIWRCATLNSWSSCIQGRFRVDSLAEANAALKNYDPESFHGDHISAKKKSDQQSAITKQNIHVSSMSGPTDREILQHLEEIVELALPLDKFKKPYEDVNTAKNLILNRVTFYQARVDVSKKQLLFLYLQLDLTSCSQDHW